MVRKVRYMHISSYFYIYKYIKSTAHWSVGSLSGEQLRIRGVTWIHALSQVGVATFKCTRLSTWKFASFCRFLFNDFMCSTVLDDDVVEKWNRALATVLCTFCRPHLPKVLRPPQFFKFMSSPTWWWCGWHMNSGSRYSLGHLLPTSSSKSAPNVTVFYDFYMKSSSRYSDVHLLSTTLPDRAPQLRKLRPFGDHGSHLIYPKKCRASRPRMFSSLNSCVPDLSHSSTNTYMMMWWPWWLKWWNRALATVSCAFFQSHLPEVLPQEQFFTILIWNRALATVSCTFSRPHLPKAFWTQQFFKIFKLKSSSRSVVCTFCRPHLAEVIRAPQFFTINLFKSFQSCIHAFPTCYTSQLRHDELAWWCGWHHGDITMMRLTYDTGLSLQSRAPFPDLIFQKCSDRDHFFTTLWNRALATVLCTFSRSHLPKVLRARQFFSHIQWKPRSRYTLVHILPTSSSRSAPSPTVFLQFLCEIELSLQCCAHFVDLIFQKRSGPDSFLLCLCEIEIATVLCTFRWPLSPIKPRNRWNRDPSATTAAAGQNTRLRAQECFQAWIHAFPISHTSELLTWWCGWHMKSASGYSLVHLFPTSCSKSAPNVTVFFPFLCEIELSLPSRAPFPRPHLPKVLQIRTHQLEVELSLQSRAHFVDLIGLRPTVFYDFLCEVELSLQSCAHFVVLRARQSFTIFVLKRALAAFLCTFVDRFPRSRCNRGNRDPPSATTAATLPEKIPGFAPESVFQA